MERMDYFLELYGSLPRAGPGNNASTRKAFELIECLPSQPRILDIGCGPGMQTIEVLELSGGNVVALDIFPQMIARLKETAATKGLSDRLQVLEADMNEMSFEASSFDLIWSEGAIYFLGFEKGLAKVKEFVKPEGYVVVSEAVWLKTNPPQGALEFWQEYPEIDSVENKLKVISKLGYQNIAHFTLPASAWTELYYDPMSQRIDELKSPWRGVSEAEEVLEEARKEIALFKKHSDYFSYAFFIMRR